MTVNKVAQRRETKIASIVEAAWGLAGKDGIQMLSLHALAKEVGMRQPSLYAYFDSKNALYDAMFADGNRELLATAGLARACRPTRGPPSRCSSAPSPTSPSRTRHGTRCSSAG